MRFHMDGKPIYQALRPSRDKFCSIKHAPFEGQIFPNGAARVLTEMNTFQQLWRIIG